MTRLFISIALVVAWCASAPGQPSPRVMVGPDGPTTGNPGSAPVADLGNDADPTVQSALLSVSSPTPLIAAVRLATPVNRTYAAGPRMQRLKSLNFDRRPGAMLKAWAPKAKVEVDPQAPPRPPKKPEDEKLEREIEEFQLAVAQGKWADVRAYLRGLTPIEAKATYGQMLRSLSVTPMDPQVQMRMQQGMQIPPAVLERHVFHTDDLIGLIASAPGELTREHVRSIGGMLRQALTSGVVVEHVLERLAKEVARPKNQALLSDRQAARLLAEAGQLPALGRFLPEPEQALKDKDLEALNLLARHYLELHAKEKKSPYLDKAWVATLNILALEGSREEKEQALRRAVELAPRVKAELGQAWLDQSYTHFPDRGMDILATLGSLVAQGIQTNPHNTVSRVQGLQLQKTAVDALLKASPKKADEWNTTLTLLASNWLKEADYTRQFDRTTGYDARMRRDMYGNFYFFNPDDDLMQQQQMMMRQQGLPQAVTTPDILRCAPSLDWLQRTDGGVKPKIDIVLSQLYLKVGDEEKAFPYIAALAGTHPEQAKELIAEFLRVWTRNHDPNAAKNQNRFSWVYFYGFEQRSESIPLTRSKQERNLLELGEWVEKIRSLKLGDIDEDMLARAFTACHSSAEVYKTEAIERVFGSLEKLQPKTLASLAQTMRANLAGIWRIPAEQEKQKTKRKQKDIEIEVRRGYDVALATVDNGLSKFAEHWALLAAKAALLHDQITYEQEIAKSSDFTAQRAAAMKLFRLAAERYRDVVAKQTLTEDEETTQVYDQWFYASLGAVDLGQITEDRQADLKQPALIRQALTGLPDAAAKRHMDKFANALFTRMSSAKPQVKFRYLKGGFEIVDADHKLAVEARKVHDYYKDLVTEIKLDAIPDGSTSVGHGQPFGLFVNLRHTRDIERESGGFGRYLLNQNSLMYSYNYGRPTADYRDRFETAVKEALKEHFEVVSVTFQSDKVNSRAHRDFGWRVTPYAYILMKPRGPQVDKIPPLRLDLDFLDTSGYVVLPIESPSVPIDSSAAKPEPRPVKKVQITQTLDERQADKGKLVLEIKATAIGLIGPLDSLLTIDVPSFDVVKTDDNGVNVSKYDEVGDGIAVVSERNWTVTMKAKDGLTQLPTSFRFGAGKVDVDEMIYQRYQDADVQAVGPEISLEKRFGERSLGWKPWAAGGGGLGILALFGIGAWRYIRAVRRAPSRSPLPQQLTPFTVIDFLTKVRGNASADQRAELDRAIADIESHYFASKANGQAPDLGRIVARWAATAYR